MCINEPLSWTTHRPSTEKLFSFFIANKISLDYDYKRNQSMLMNATLHLPSSSSPGVLEPLRWLLLLPNYQFRSSLHRLPTCLQTVVICSLIARDVLMTMMTIMRRPLCVRDDAASPSLTSLTHSLCRDCGSAIFRTSSINWICQSVLLWTLCVSPQI